MTFGAETAVGDSVLRTGGAPLAATDEVFRQERPASGVTPSVSRRSSRLGWRTRHAAACQLLRRVSRLFFAVARPTHFQGRSLRLGARHCCRWL